METPASIEKVVAQKVTRQQLKELKLDQSIAFELPNYAAVESARNTAYQYQRIIGARFECNFSGETTLVITKKRKE